MPRVKDIKQPLQSLPFLPVIQGKGDEAESCGTIVSHRSCEGQKGYAHTGPVQIRQDVFVAWIANRSI